MPDQDGPWWKDAVFYQIYPRSFADGNGDGIGDLPGVIGKLDYLRWLGVDAIWLNPIMSSPNDDWGYDVSDYRSVHPDFGTLDDVDTLIAEADRRGIRILLDFVPNHTSAEHDWFLEARSGRDSAHRDWYVWADPSPDGSPPNNWISGFGGLAWDLDESTGQFYLHNFLDTQPDLNWWNEDVRAAMDDVLRFWYERGVAGFRIDVAHAVIKDKQLRDNVAATEEDHPFIQRHGQRLMYNTDQPEVHDVIRRWREVGDLYEPPRVLVGETFLFDLERVARYYGKGDELHLAFNFPFVFAPFEAKNIREIVERTYSVLPELAWPVFTGSNHDVSRFPTRWCAGEVAKSRLALVMLMTLRGTIFLYYGDEIGMPDTVLPYEQLRDPVGLRLWPDNKGRDSCRTPMHWSADLGAGFTSSDAQPWLPFGDYRAVNVADQRGDPKSVLSLTRTLIALRKATRDLGAGGFESIDAPDGVWAYRRGFSIVVALNFSDDRVATELSGTIVLSSNPDRATERIERLRLSPWEGVVLKVD